VKDLSDEAWAEKAHAHWLLDGEPARKRRRASTNRRHPIRSLAFRPTIYGPLDSRSPAEARKIDIGHRSCKTQRCRLVFMTVGGAVRSLRQLGVGERANHEESLAWVPVMLWLAALVALRRGFRAEVRHEIQFPDLPG
jgi:hypothetical protein